VSKERDHAIAQHDAAYQKGQGACLADQQRRDQLVADLTERVSELEAQVMKV